MTRIERWTPGNVDGPQLEAVAEMTVRAFAGMLPEPTAADRTASQTRRTEVWANGDATRPELMMHVLFSEDQPVARAETFVREIHGDDCPSGKLRVMALAGVSVEPARQGLGFGQQIVRDAFARMDELQVTHCLFQTGLARSFYEKLGATCVNNWFFDGTSQTPKSNPWQDRYVMVYPADATWPAGAIDLNGLAY